MNASPPNLIARFRYLISAPALIVHGHIESERSVNVIAESFEPLAIVSTLADVHSFG
jgi:hypothetical protein